MIERLVLSLLLVALIPFVLVGACLALVARATGEGWHFSPMRWPL